MAAVYHDPHKPVATKDDSRVIRGRARCVAADFEDQFAGFIYEKILRAGETNLCVFTDFPITIEPAREGQTRNGRKRVRETRYIDVMVCSEKDRHNYNILYMAELKTNTGWMRDQVDGHLKQNDKFIEHLLLSTTKISARSESLKEALLSDSFKRCHFYVSAGLCYDLIVLSSTNNNVDDLDELKKSTKSKSCRLIVLTDASLGGGEAGECPKPRESDFWELYARVGECLKHANK